MVTFVVVFNILIALINFYIAWRVWQLRRTIAGVATAILVADRNTYNTLHGAPNAIATGQKGTKAAREQYRQLEIQLQKLRQLLGLLNFAQQVWRRRSRQTRKSKSIKKSLPKYL